MRKLLVVGLLALGCGGESQADFDGAVQAAASAAGTGGNLVKSRDGDGGTGSDVAGGSNVGGTEEAGAPAASGSSSGGGGAETAGSSSGGTGGTNEAGTAGMATEGGSSGSGGSGGAPVAGSGGMPTAGSAGSAAGGGGKSSEPEVPAACEACRNDALMFCDVSSVHPNGACIRCSDDGIPGNDIYRDCDGPGAEHYVSKNDHDPGYGCETYVGFMGSCPGN